MLDLTTTNNQENSAAQGLLALRDCDSGSGSNNNSPQSDSNSMLTTPELHPNTKNNLVLQQDYRMPPPFDTSIDHQFNEKINNDKDIKLSYADSQSRKYLKPTCAFDKNNNTEQIACNQPNNFNTLQRRYSNQLIYSPQQYPSRVTLPSIKDMLAQYPLSRYHKGSDTNISSSHGIHPEKYARAIATHPYLQKHTLVSLELLKKHSARMLETDTRVKSKSPVENKVSSPSNEKNEPELDSFFYDLRKQYREEFEKELKEQESQSNTETTETTDTQDVETEEESDDGSIYQPSSSETNKSATRNKKPNPKNKKNRHFEKPRWTIQEKAELFEAIVRHKSLDVMATFDWVAIGADIGRLDKACKDQWRRGILKMFRDYVSKL